MKLNIIGLTLCVGFGIGAQLNVEQTILNKLEQGALTQKGKPTCGSSKLKLLDVNIPMADTDALPGTACAKKNRSPKELTRQTDEGMCTHYYTANDDLPCCCSTDNKERELYFKPPKTTAGECDLSKLYLKVNLEDSCTPNESTQSPTQEPNTPFPTASPTPPDTMKCCEDCKCFGDPHCETDVESSDEKIRKSFVLCDIRDAYTKKSDCGVSAGGQIASSDKYKNRCLGEHPDYDFNKGNCVWLPNKFKEDESDPKLREKYRFKDHGSPCVPTEKYAAENPMHMKTFNNGVKLYTILGERGSIVKVQLIAPGHEYGEAPIAIQSEGNDQSSILELDAKYSCVSWCKPGDNCKTVFNQPNFQWVENTSFARTGLNSVSDIGKQETDKMWTINIDDKLVAQFKCLGGTLQAADYNVQDANTKLLYSQLKNGAFSTRDNVNTRIDISVKQTTGERQKFDEGFCKLGEFAELQNIYGDRRPFENCEFQPRLDMEDYKFFSKIETAGEKCFKLLEDNKCDGFLTPKALKKGKLFGSNRDIQNFQTLMKECVKHKCASYNYANVGGVESAPPGTDYYECLADSFDFGANFVDDTYNAIYSNDITESNSVCEKKLYAHVPGYGTHDITDSGELVLDLDEEISGHIRIYQTVCPDDCGFAQRITADIKISTYCHELERFALGVSSDTVSIIDGKPVLVTDVLHEQNSVQ